LTHFYSFHLIFLCMRRTPNGCMRTQIWPQSIMSARPWNTVAKRKILLDLMGKILQTTEEQYGRATAIFNDYLNEFTDANDLGMDIDSLLSLEDGGDLLDDNDVLDGMENTFDPMESLVPITITYRKFLLQDLESNVDFNIGHLHIDNLSEVECVDERFDLLRKPLSMVLEFVPDSNDMVRVKFRYAVPHETGLLMILFRLARPHRVRSDMEVCPSSLLHFWCLWYFY
jgi:hypothetical protein